MAVRVKEERGSKRHPVMGWIRINIWRESELTSLWSSITKEPD